MGRLRQCPKRLSGDKACSFRRTRMWPRQHGIGAVVPRRSHEKAYLCSRAFDHDAYRRRNVVERCVGWLKEHRRIATRFEKLATSFLAMLKMAMVL